MVKLAYDITVIRRCIYSNTVLFQSFKNISIDDENPIHGKYLYEKKIIYIIYTYHTVR